MYFLNDPLKPPFILLLFAKALAPSALIKSKYNFKKLKKLFFNWRIIVLQNFVVFCQTWICHRCTYILSLLKLPSPSPSHLPRLLQSPCLSSLIHIANSYWLSILIWEYISFHVTLSIHLTFSPPALFHKSVLYICLLLPYK